MAPRHTINIVCGVEILFAQMLWTWASVFQ